MICFYRQYIQFDSPGLDVSLDILGPDYCLDKTSLDKTKEQVYCFCKCVFKILNGVQNSSTGGANEHV